MLTWGSTDSCWGRLHWRGRGCCWGEFALCSSSGKLQSCSMVWVSASGFRSSTSWPNEWFHEFISLDLHSSIIEYNWWPARRKSRRRSWRSCWWVIQEWANPISYPGSPKTSSTWRAKQPSGLNLPPRWSTSMGSRSRCRSGTLPARSDTDPWPVPTTEGQWEPCSSTTSPGLLPFRISRSG